MQNTCTYTLHGIAPATTDKKCVCTDHNFHS
uniref:Uncharacterized protein n=1 Tax=Anguilla anguilla TaxID=7936 RepID=A0A0E9Q1Y8_ANGAN